MSDMNFISIISDNHQQTQTDDIENPELKIIITQSRENRSKNIGNHDARKQFCSSHQFTILPEFDYDYSLVQNTASGMPLIKKITTAASGAAGTLGSAIFGIAIDLETSNGLEISGLNAEEQSDISLIVRYSKPQGSVGNSMVFDVFTYIDSMIVLRENNVLELIQ